VAELRRGKKSKTEGKTVKKNPEGWRVHGKKNWRSHWTGGQPRGKGYRASWKTWAENPEEKLVGGFKVFWNRKKGSGGGDQKSTPQGEREEIKGKESFLFLTETKTAEKRGEAINKI